MSANDDLKDSLDMSVPDDVAAGKEEIFNPKKQPKVIRVLTVMAYALSVSMAAILLSIYYIFMWEGRPHLGALRSPADHFNFSEHNARFSNNSSWQLTNERNVSKMEITGDNNTRSEVNHTADQGFYSYYFFENATTTELTESATLEYFNVTTAN
ncbi:uncharacterized protein LOC132707691 isoform X2 [Cylas formicarius]|uniref:uncharacterized protein LOC132707691 isoform X2 n=1 Tax=Cylas formicarius TaxID=197179 RepID=UPI0029588182|nr:uncharacterized protein LOC132707691 isoform X2 [Cylas formicarius]